MTVSKETQLERFSRKVKSLKENYYSGILEIRLESGNIVHISEIYNPEISEILDLIKTLQDNSFYGKISLTLEKGKIVKLSETRNSKIHI